MKWAKLAAASLFYYILGIIAFTFTFVALEIDNTKVLDFVYLIWWLLIFFKYYLPQAKDIHDRSDTE